MTSAYAAPTLFFRPASLEDLDAIHALESCSYPEDEAASREKLEYRIQHAPECFLLAVQAPASSSAGTEGGGAADDIVGFVCGTCTSAASLTHDSMSSHEQDGQLLCIHSVVVQSALRRQGFATKLLRTYLGYVAGTSPQLSQVRLICKDELIPLYQGAGFELVGPSDVVHGQDPWQEMALALQQQGGSGS